jgi:L-ascorbate metabolism protein UlaG (beta-lactamase superfamily)
VIPDIITVSHNHRDHNAVKLVSGNPTILYGKERTDNEPHQKFIQIDDTIKDIRIYTVKSNHFKPSISPELNAIFVFEFDGIRIVHLGDLGTTLNEEQIDKIGAVDILMIPVGGKYTITHAEVDSVINQLKPSMAVIPMHFKTKFADFVPFTAEDFIKGQANIERIEGNEYTLKLKDVPKAMKYIEFEYFK